MHEPVLSSTDCLSIGEAIFDDSGFVADYAAREYEGFAEQVTITEG